MLLVLAVLFFALLAAALLVRTTLLFLSVRKKFGANGVVIMVPLGIGLLTQVLDQLVTDDVFRSGWLGFFFVLGFFCFSFTRLWWMTMGGIGLKVKRSWQQGGHPDWFAVVSVFPFQAVFYAMNADLAREASDAQANITKQTEIYKVLEYFGENETNFSSPFQTFYYRSKYRHNNRR
jgi:hypothetical protein